MKQMTFSDVEYSGRKRITRKEKFLNEMDAGVFDIILCYGMQGRTIATSDWIVCAIVLAIIAFGLILIPENAVFRHKDTTA